MGKQIIKIAPDRDLYVEWSSVVEAPTAWGTRAEMAAWLQEPKQGYGQITIAAADAVEDRLARADRTGSSGYPPFGCTWDDWGEIYMQQGKLPRSRFGALIDRYAAHPDIRHSTPDVRDLLDPFDDDLPASPEDTTDG